MIFREGGVTFICGFVTSTLQMSWQVALSGLSELSKKKKIGGEIHWGGQEDYDGGRLKVGYG